MKTSGMGFTRTSLIFPAVIAGIACTRPAPAGDKGILPVVERHVYVELPSQANALSAAAKGDYDHGRRLVSHTRPRCVDKPDPATNICQRAVDVQVTAVEGARYIDSVEPPKNPQLIAWIENLGSEKTFDGLLPRGEARYAVVVNSVASKTAAAGVRPELALVEILKPARYRVAPRSFTARVIPWGHVYACHVYRQPYLSDVDFRPCDPSASLTPPKSRWLLASAMTSLLGSSTAVYVDDPMWFTCSSGCCSNRYAN